MKWRVKEFARLTGVSVRTLHYYDEIGLLLPASVDNPSGYRYYDDASLFRMQEILFYRELDFSLKTIAQILSSPNYDKEQALSQQKKLLTLKKERLEGLIAAIDGAMKGENVMKAFNNQEFETYKAEAQNRWGKTQAYQEFSEKTKDYSEEKEKSLASQMDTILEEFALCMKKGSAPQVEEAQALVKKLQAHITESYYVCTNDILAGLGQMYVADERFQQNIDKHGEGTSQFISQAIAFFCKQA